MGCVLNPHKPTSVSPLEMPLPGLSSSRAAGGQPHIDFTVDNALSAWSRGAVGFFVLQCVLCAPLSQETLGIEPMATGHFCSRKHESGTNLYPSEFRNASQLLTVLGDGVECCGSQQQRLPWKGIFSHIPTSLPPQTLYNLLEMRRFNVSGCLLCKLAYTTACIF